MGQDFCSAPGMTFIIILNITWFSLTTATSVDAERAFSTGRRHVNHMQHNMSSQTFKARMALGSWAKSPMFPPFSEVANMISGVMQSESKDQ